MARRFDRHAEVIVGVIFAVAIFDAGEGRSHDIFGASADAPAVELVAARQTVNAVVIDSLHLGVGVSALGVQQNVLADREADARADVEIARSADRSFVAQNQQVGLALLGRAVSDFSFNADYRRAEVKIITGSQAIEEAVLGAAFVFDFQANLVVTNDCADLGTTEVRRFLRESRSRDGRQSSGSDYKLLDGIIPLMFMCR